MIKHIVMFELKNPADAAEAVELAEAMNGQIPTLIKLEAFATIENAPQGNWHFVLICDFADRDALEAYRVHPVHVAFGQFITPRRTARSCIDYEV